MNIFCYIFLQKEDLRDWFLRRWEGYVIKSLISCYMWSFLLSGWSVFNHLLLCRVTFLSITVVSGPCSCASEIQGI